MVAQHATICYNNCSFFVFLSKVILLILDCGLSARAMAPTVRKAASKVFCALLAAMKLPESHISWFLPDLLALAFHREILLHTF